MLIINVLGQSAGAASVHLLMLSPSTNGLFQKAIAQSGVAILPWAFTEISKKRAFQLGSVLGFATNDTNKLMGNKKSLFGKKLSFKII